MRVVNVPTNSTAPCYRAQLLSGALLSGALIYSTPQAP